MKTAGDAKRCPRTVMAMVRPRTGFRPDTVVLRDLLLFTGKGSETLYKNTDLANETYRLREELIFVT